MGVSFQMGSSGVKVLDQALAGPWKNSAMWASCALLLMEIKEGKRKGHGGISKDTPYVPLGTPFNLVIITSLLLIY